MIQRIIQAFMPPKKMIDLFTLKMSSTKPIELVAQQVQNACESNNFVLLQSYNYHEIVESKGFPMKRKVFIYDICQAKTASLMLSTNPHFAIFMPCTLAIYEHDNETIISTMNMELLLNAVRSNKELYNEAKALFSSFKSLMTSLTI
ncbi:MAG: DUF302 domain-containing protein [Bacteroidetes bacterium]|nr:DUF302 domain-containing protein [Bacteroidota bacterium]